jgi:hypothetical protein
MSTGVRWVLMTTTRPSSSSTPQTPSIRPSRKRARHPAAQPIPRPRIEERPQLGHRHGPVDCTFGLAESIRQLRLANKSFSRIHRRTPFVKQQPSNQHGARCSQCGSPHPWPRPGPADSPGHLHAADCPRCGGRASLIRQKSRAITGARPIGRLGATKDDDGEQSMSAGLRKSRHAPGRMHGRDLPIRRWAQTNAASLHAAGPGRTDRGVSN